MDARAFWLAACLAGMAGCASHPPVPPAAEIPWLDQAFAYDPALVVHTRESLFRLDPELLEKLQSSEFQRLRAHERFDRLLDLVFGPGHQRFDYAPGNSTTAAETWKLKRGDCLSLAVLTYSVGRAMRLDPLVQEVEVPALYDRRGDFDFANQHVNVLFRDARRNLADGAAEGHSVIVDFEPELGSNRFGRTLSETAILARFYNNLGAQHLARGDRARAYAHFRAAIAADPAFGASYANLAVLYRNNGKTVDAERLLRQSVGLSNPPDVALRSLRLLLLEQGRNAEALQYAGQLQALRDRDPYHWIGMGVRYLQGGEFSRAVSALEQAQQMANGFAEVHRFLAVAYWRVGDRARANEQLALLTQLDAGDPGIKTLREKFGPGTPGRGSH